jgi:ABC-2 type transport system permease protein
MTAALRMEWLRLRTVRSTYWLLFVAAIATIGIGVTVLAVYRTHVPVPGAAQMVNDGLSGVALGQLLIGFLGVLIMTGEYSSGMIRATLAAVPDRKRVLVAKAAVFAGVGFVVAEAACFAAFFAGQAALSGSPVPTAGLGDPGVLRTVVFNGAYLTLIGLVGVGLGAMIRHTGAAVATLFGLLFVPPFVLGVLGSAGIQVATFTPMIILLNSVGVVTPTPGCLSAWAGLGVIALYAAVALGLGGWLLTRRDA